MSPAAMLLVDLEMSSRHGAITGIATAYAGLRSGVLSIAHGWGALPTPGARPRPGANTGRLIDAEDADRFSAHRG